MATALAVIACAVAWGSVSTTVNQNYDQICALQTNNALITEILTKLDKNQALILQRLEALEKRSEE